MTKYKNEGEMYLQMYPAVSKWMNECIICHAKGYKPDMPTHISREGSVAGGNIRQYFNPLAVDELHICAQCGKFARQNDYRKNTIDPKEDFE